MNIAVVAAVVGEAGTVVIAGEEASSYSLLAHQTLCYRDTSHRKLASAGHMAYSDSSAPSFSKYSHCFLTIVFLSQ